MAGIVSKAAAEFRAGAGTGSRFVSDASTAVSDAAQASGARAVSGEDCAAFGPMMSSLKGYAQVSAEVAKSPYYVAKGVRGFRQVQAAARFVRANGAKGSAAHAAKATGRAGKNAAVRAAQAAGAVAGAVAKSILAPLLVVAGTILVVSLIVPGVLSSITASTAATVESTVVSMGDDYPWRGSELAGMVNGINPATNYAYGNCTDFAFWRVNRDRMLREGSDEQKQLVASVMAGSWTWDDAMGTSWPFPYSWATLTPGSGNGGEWGLPDRMPGWDFVPDAALAMAGDILSIKPGTHGHHAAYGHVAYVAWVDVDAEKIVTENYGRGMYYQREYTFVEFNAALKDGSFVVRHDPANDGTVLASMPMAGGDPNAQANTPEGAKAYAASKMAAYGWDANEYSCLVALWEHESGWRYDADNPYSDALGIPQGMTNLYPEVASERYRIDGNYQVDWGFDYIKGRYGSPCAAWAHWQNPPNYAAWGHWY